MSSVKTKLYQKWCSMKARCQNPNTDNYKHYGGRGITVCESWQQFSNFKLWAEGAGYSEGLSIERKDINGNYCPENCTWIPLADQKRNQRKRKDNSSGVCGVHKAYKRGKPLYIAQWMSNGRRKSKQFMVQYYGEEEAFKLAKEYREKQLNALKDSGIYYGEQHGK